jgi:hypothetical protein
LQQSQYSAQPHTQPTHVPPTPISSLILGARPCRPAHVGHRGERSKAEGGV